MAELLGPCLQAGCASGADGSGPRLPPADPGPGPLRTWDGRRLRSPPCPAPFVSRLTGAAGQIGYAILPRIASGQMLGPDQPVILQLLEVTPALKALDGVAMELEDCAFPLLADVVKTDDADVAFGDADVALLIGAMPRKAGMERADLLSANGAIFTVQGKAIAANAKADCKVLVVGQPGQHQRAHRDAQRQGHGPGPLHRDDPPRPQPRHQPAGRQGRRAGLVHQAHDHLGQPLHHAVPRPVPLRGGREERRRAGGRPGVAGERVHPDGRQAGRRHHRGARGLLGGIGGQCRHRSRAGLAPRHAGGRLGEHVGAVRRVLRRARGADLVVPGRVPQRGATKSSRASRSTSSPGPASTPRSRSWPRSATRWPSSASSDPASRQAMGDFAAL